MSTTQNPMVTTTIGEFEAVEEDVSSDIIDADEFDTICQPGWGYIAGECRPEEEIDLNIKIKTT